MYSYNQKDNERVTSFDNRGNGGKISLEEAEHLCGY